MVPVCSEFNHHQFNNEFSLESNNVNHNITIYCDVRVYIYETEEPVDSAKVHVCTISYENVLYY